MRKATVRGLFAALAFFLACGLYGQKAGDFELSLEGNGVTITGYKGSAAEVHIPAQVEGIPVTAIGERAVYECSSLERITIPAGVTASGDEAFSRCSSL
ncbi:MAG: leucine-rich repeat domain-containing protein [Treponema sp.]|jgi:hypothetical protein|nr:leucine-rich repeat domain-containing protein [Treponema sp.]